MLDLSKKVADSLGTHFQQPAPYVLEPSLRRDHQVSAGQVCPCSYPSRHASAAASSRAYLAHFMPHRLADYRWMEDEVDYSRLYMAGHVPSDIRGGTLLGDMIAEYFLVTREGVARGTGGADDRDLAGAVEHRLRRGERPAREARGLAREHPAAAGLLEGLGTPLPVSYTHLTLPTICSV